MSLAQGNNTPTRPRIEPGSPDPESDALTIRPVRPPALKGSHNYSFTFWSRYSHQGFKNVRTSSMRLVARSVLCGRSHFIIHLYDTENNACRLVEFTSNPAK